MPLETQGWLRLPSALTPARLAALPVDENCDGAGRRDLLEQPWCAALVAPIRSRLHALGVLADDAVAVQCSLFRKTADCNWNVPYYQDLSIPVAGRIDRTDAGGVSGRSRKDDGDYVQPPVALLERMLAVRLHLDDCAEAEGALRVVPGSHRWGRLSPQRIAAMPKRERERLCAASAGDLILMRPLLLHASSKASRPNGRRVLHFLFGPAQPGDGLQWRMAL